MTTSSNPTSGAPIQQVRDKIAQAYLGLWGDNPTQERARRRLHWLAKQCQGEDVLDIGCSEGMLAILLAREGISVTGVDVNPEEIEFARELLHKEHEFVQSRVDFVLADIIVADLKKPAYDTAVLGEVIEHLVRPELMIDRALKLVKPGGRLLITTPFGYFPDIDHRQSFVLTQIINILSTRCKPVELSIKDGYIRFAGLNETPTKQDWRKYDQHHLLGESEKAIIETQHILQDRINGYKDRQKQLQQDLNQNQQAIAASRKTCADLDTRVQGLEKAVVVREGETGRLKHQLASLQGEHDDTLKRTDSLKQQLEQTGNREKQLQEQLKSISAEKEVLQAKNTQLFESEERFRDKIEELRARNDQQQEGYHAKLRELEQMQAWSKTLQDDLQRVVQQSEIQNRELAILREQLDRAQAETQRAWDELEKRNKEVSRLGALADHAETEARELKAVLQDRDDKLAKIQQDLAGMTDQATQYREAFENAALDIAQHRERLDQTIKALSEQTELVDLLKAEKAEVSQALEHAHVKKDEAEAMIEDVEADCRQQLKDAEAQQNEQENIQYLNAQLKETQELARRIQMQFETHQIEQNSKTTSPGEQQTKSDRVKTTPKQLEKQKQAIEASLLEHQSEMGRLKQGQMRLQNSYDLLAKREYLSRTRSLEVEQTIAYKLGIAITQAMAHPGFKSLGRILSEFGHSISMGRRKMRNVSDPVVLNLEVLMPNGQEKTLAFTTTQPEKIKINGRQILFAQPANESVRLITKPIGKISEAPGAPALPLKPDQSYMLSGKFTLQGGRAAIHVIEYSEKYCLQGRDYPLRTGDWRENWRTHIDHTSLCLALELMGKGSLTIDEFSVERTSQIAVTTQAMSANDHPDGDKWAPLSSDPLWFDVKAPSGALLVIKGRVRFHGAADRKPGYALAQIIYLDQAGKELPGPFKGTAYQKDVGWFNYMRVPENDAIPCELMRLAIPPNAARIKFGFRASNAQSPVEMFTGIQISEQDGWAFPRFETPQPETQGKPVVASILDPFSEACFRFDLNLVPITRENWRKEIEAAAPKMLLVESAWQGNGGQWSSVLTRYAENAENPLRQLLAWCRKQSIPTVFWNKEDPPNFDVFIDVARDCDFIFTTDQNCIPEYRKRCGHDRIYCLPFAAQPAIHNPIGKQEIDEYDIAFAGTWYKRKHPERSELLPNVLDPASKYHLYIFDRMSDWLTDDSFQYPERYQAFLQHKISYEEMLFVHRAFKLILNTNSVIESPTMFSRRIFEVLASATPVVSTASKGVQEMFGDLVPVVIGPEQARLQIDRLMENPWHRKQLGHLGYREVMLKHTVDKRIREIFDRIGLTGFVMPEEWPKVTLAVATNRPDHLDQVQKNFECQNYPNLELVLVLNSEAFDKAEVERRFAAQGNVKVFQLPSAASLGECLNKAIDESTGQYWAKMDDDNLYLANYITDLMLPFRYSKADVVGKTTHFVYMERTGELMLRFPEHEHSYEDVVNGGTLLIKHAVFSQVRFPSTSIGEDTQFLTECLEKGMRVYSADCFNCVITRKADISRHTWEIEEAELLRKCIKIADGLELDFVDPGLGIVRLDRKPIQTPAAKQPVATSTVVHASAVSRPEIAPATTVIPTGSQPHAGSQNGLAAALDQDTVAGIMKTFGQDIYDLKPFLNGADGRIHLTNQNESIQLFKSADAYYLPVKSNWMYQMQGLGYCANGNFDKSSLIQFLFLDKSNKIIEGQYTFSSYSKNFGNFKYLSVGPDGSDNDFEVVTPANGVTIIVGFRLFNTQQPVEVNPAWRFTDVGKFITPDDYAQDYDRFFEMADQSESETVVFLFASTKSIGMSHRGNRPMRFARMIADRGIPIIYNYYRWRSSADIITYDGGTLFQSPIDVTSMKMVDIATHEYKQKRKIFLLSMPNSDAVKYLGLFKEYDWTVIYECRDDWEEFWKAGVGKWYHPLLEQYVTAKSDGVTTVSCTLRDKMNQWCLPGALPPRIIPNGLDSSFTRKSVQEFIEERRKRATGRTVIGYHGHLTGAWFDWDLIIETARSKSEWRFEIIGFDAPNDLDLPDNVVYMGSKSHEEIQEVATGWTVAIIPFKPSKLAEGVDPIKVYEYLAMGLPVVSVNMPQILEYPCVRCYKDNRQFVNLLKKAIEAPFAADEVAEWLKTRRWEDRIDETFAFADELRQREESAAGDALPERGVGIPQIQSSKADAGKATSSTGPKAKTPRKQKKRRNVRQ